MSNVPTSFTVRLMSCIPESIASHSPILYLKFLTWYLPTHSCFHPIVPLPTLSSYPLHALFPTIFYTLSSNSFQFPPIPSPSLPFPPITILRPPISTIPKPPHKHRHMKMLPALPLPLPHHKLDFHLRKKRLCPFLLEISFRIKRQTPPLVARRVGEDVGKRGGGREGCAGRGGPGCDAAVGVGVGCEGVGRGLAAVVRLGVRWEST